MRVIEEGPPLIGPTPDTRSSIARREGGRSSRQSAVGRGRGQMKSGFESLRVYELAYEGAMEIFRLSKTFPPEEKYSLTDQIRRSSRSIGANVAEAWKKRRYVAHFTSKLTDADGEQSETIHWLDTAHACEYVLSEQYNELIAHCEEVGRMLGTIIRDADTWCPH